MTVTITRLFDDYPAASQVVRDLEAAGLASSNISIMAGDAEKWQPGTGRARPAVDRDRDGADDRAEGAQVGAGIGVVAGGAAGLLAGLGLIAIPGFGPVVAAGWLAATAAGAAAIGVAGGIIGALTEAGVSAEEAPVYAEGVRRGGAIVTARVPDSEVTRYEAILDRSAVDIEERETAYRASGWRGYDETIPPRP
jgi:hypothetical protein